MKFERNQLNTNFYQEGGGGQISKKRLKKIYNKLQETNHIDHFSMR